MRRIIKIVVIVASVIFHGRVIYAQGTSHISMQSAIDSAVKHRKEILIQKVNADYSQNEVRKAESRLLPQLTGDIDIRYNGELPTQIIPGEAFGAAGSPSRRVKFGATYATTGGFDLTIPIYNPSNRGDRKIAKVQAEYDRLNVQKSEIDIEVEVIKSYFNGLIDLEKLKLSKSNEDHTLAVYTMNKDQLAKGAITNYDLEKARINYQNAVSENDRNENTYRLALADLIYRMGIDSIREIVLTDSLSGLYHQYRDIISTENTTTRIEIRQGNLQEQIYQENINKQKKSYLPTISAYGNLTAQNLNNKFTPFDGAYWFPYNYIGIKASIPIFDGFTKRRTKYGYELQLRSAQLTTEKLKRDYQFDIQTTKVSLLNDQKDLANQRNNLDNANELYRIDSDRLQKGAIRETDLLATYYALQQSQANYLNSIYAFLFDVVQYKKALGSL